MTDVVLMKNTISKIFELNPNCNVRIAVDNVEDTELKEKLYNEISSFLLQKYYYFTNCFEFCLFTVGIPS
jgi:hypothetical protein